MIIIMGEKSRVGKGNQKNARTGDVAILNRELGGPHQERYIRASIRKSKQFSI